MIVGFILSAKLQIKLGINKSFARKLRKPAISASFSFSYAIARCQAKTTLKSYWHELRDHQEYCKKIAMKTGTHTQVPLTFASDYRDCSISMK